jgi:acyl-coenzyme A thioesterase PaaI-like protein
MRESFGTWLDRLRFNLYPAFRGTGAKVIHISADRRTIRIKLPLNWRTRNIYGTLFGGALYAATDPLYAILVKIGLGPGYIVWDKAGAIRYRKPGRTTLYAECSVSDAELADLRERLRTEPSVDLDYEINLSDAAGVVHAVVMKTIYVARKETYLRKLEQERASAAV